MVPQQGSDLSPTSNGVMFGSQMVDKNSATPYSDATQVRRFWKLKNYFVIVITSDRL